MPTAKPVPNKSQAIRDHLKAHPSDGPAAVVAALKKKGIDVTTNLVGLVKYSSSKKSAAKSVSKPSSIGGSKPGMNRSDAVRQYIATHPSDSPGMIQKALAAKGVKISKSLASAIKYRKSGAKKAARSRAAGKAPVAKAMPNGALSAESLVAAKQFADRVGSIDAAKRLLDVLQRIA